jgi:predicted  nucleic acid-binding Zn-ribbon protein
MPHKCVRCGTIYGDGAQEILDGCECGAKLFFYVRKEHVKKAEELTDDLSDHERRQIESDILDLIGKERENDAPVILDFEAVVVKKPGQYELDLVHLFKGDPVVIKLEEGKYFIDLKQSLRRK